MISNNLNKEAMNTARQLGNTCSARTGYRMLQEAESKHRHMLNGAIREAIKQKWFIAATIDDYTSIKTHRRPTEDKASTAINMGTVVVSIFKDIKAIPWNEPSELNFSSVIDDNDLTRFIASEENMYLLRSTYASVMPEWLTESFLTHK